MAYSKTTWVNNSTPAINATNLNNMEGGIYNNDVKSNYITFTAGSNGDFKANTSITLATGMIIYGYISEAATTGTANARLSIDNGSNYKNVKTSYGTQIIGDHIESGWHTFRYNGTDMICEELDILYTSFEAYMPTPNTSTADNTLINYSAENYDIGSNYDTTNKKFTAPVSGLYIISASIAVSSPTDQQRYGIKLRKNGSTDIKIKLASASGTGAFYISETWQIYLAANDYLQCYSFMQSTKDILFSDVYTYFYGRLEKKATI